VTHGDKTYIHIIKIHTSHHPFGAKKKKDEEKPYNAHPV
jgi:hypothetical protein